MTTVHTIRAPEARPEPLPDGTSRGWEVAVSKGAPDVLLDCARHYQTIDDQSAPLTPEVRQSILAPTSPRGQALRVLGMAYKVQREGLSTADGAEIESDLTFIGLAGMIDPPRREVAAAQRVALSAGIRTVMITGDYANTARAIAQEIGLIGAEGNVLSGAELEAMSDDTWPNRCAPPGVRPGVARAQDAHCERTAAQWRDRGHDGRWCERSPALKKATSAWRWASRGRRGKEAADMVLRMTTMPASSPPWTGPHHLCQIASSWAFCCPATWARSW